MESTNVGIMRFPLLAKERIPTLLCLLNCITTILCLCFKSLIYIKDGVAQDLCIVLCIQKVADF